MHSQNDRGLGIRNRPLPARQSQNKRRFQRPRLSVNHRICLDFGGKRRTGWDGFDEGWAARLRQGFGERRIGRVGMGRGSGREYNRMLVR